MQKRNQLERKKYSEASDIIHKNATNTSDAALAQKLNVLARQFKRFSKEMPVAKTREQQLQQKFAEKSMGVEMER